MCTTTMTLTEARECLTLALRMYGDASVAYVLAIATPESQAAFNNMGFWQNQVWQCAKAVAELSA